MKREIIDIAPKYKTDKNDHGYIKYYAEHLPETAKKILEIGVLTGNSIRMWRELYPEAHVFGLDIFIENPIPFQADWVTWFQGNQADSKLLDDVRIHGPFDLVIDDGSHLSRHQLMTFYGLIGSCNLYIIEDLHCCKEEFWRQGMKFKHTVLGMLQTAKEVSLLGKGEWRGAYFNFPFHLYDDKIVFIEPR